MKKFFILPVMQNRLSSLLKYNKYNLCTCQNVTEALVYLLDNIILDLAQNFSGRIYNDGNLSCPLLKYVSILL